MSLDFVNQFSCYRVSEFILYSTLVYKRNNTYK